MTRELDYWKECIEIAADECEVVLTPEQLDYIADSVRSGHEHYDLAFYSPPAGDGLNYIEREWRAKYAALQQEFNAYKDNAEVAVQRALQLRRDTPISIERHGNVFRHDGRIEQIQ